MAHDTSRIDDDELLARFILSKRLIRDDQTIRSNAFVPHPYDDLSVTRHQGLSEVKLWEYGDLVALRMPTEKKLHGRADFRVVHARNQEIDVISDPLRENPNHACLVGWPSEKAEQKAIAQEISASANFVLNEH